MNKFKVIVLSAAVLCFGLVKAQDQNTTAAPAKATPVKKTMAPQKATAKGSAVKGQTSATTPKSSKAHTAMEKMPANGQHLTKSGKPDMRYKENKSATKATNTAAPMKKKKVMPKPAASATPNQ